MKQPVDSGARGFSDPMRLHSRHPRHLVTGQRPAPSHPQIVQPETAAAPSDARYHDVKRVRRCARSGAEAAPASLTNRDTLRYPVANEIRSAMTSPAWNPCDGCLDPLADVLLRLDRHVGQWSAEIDKAVPRVGQTDGIETCRRWLELNISIDYAKVFSDRVMTFIERLREWERDAKRDPDPYGHKVSRYVVFCLLERDNLNDLLEEAKSQADYLRQMSAMLRSKLRREAETSIPDRVERARAIRMTARRGSFEAQRLLAVEIAEELSAGIREPEPQRSLMLLGSLAISALEEAVKLVMMTRSNTLTTEGDFVGHYVRVTEFCSRLDTLIARDADLINRCWPLDPGITFGWKSGASALHVAEQFIRDIQVATNAAAVIGCSRFVDSLDALPVHPTPDPIFTRWRDAAIAEIRTHTVPVEGVWPTMPEIHRDSGALFHRLQDEIKRAVASLDHLHIEARTAVASSAKHPKASVNDIRTRLESMAGIGEPYTSMQKLAEALKCGKGTVHEAIHSSERLKRWADIKPAGAKASGAQRLEGANLENAVSPNAPDPSAFLPEEDIDIVMAKLIDEAGPKERARLNAMTREQRRNLVQEINRQGLDFEVSPLTKRTGKVGPRAPRVYKRV